MSLLDIQLYASSNWSLYLAEMSLMRVYVMGRFDYESDIGVNEGSSFVIDINNWISHLFLI